MAATTAVQDRSTITVSMAKLFMRVDISTEDTLIALMLAAAKQKADDYCLNEFVDALDVELDIPSPVEMWVLQTTSKYYNHRIIGLKKEELLDLGSFQMELGSDVDINYDGLKPYRLEPGFGMSWY